MKTLPAFVLPLSVSTGVLVGVAAACGLLLDSSYASEAASFALQGKAQDLVTLVWVIPLYAVVLHRLGKGSSAARLAWLGVLLYFTYTYLLASMGLAYNRLFLLYVAIYGTSLGLLITGVSSVSTADLATRFSSGFPRRATAVFMIALGSMLGLLWLGAIVPSLVTGAPPALLNDTVTQSPVVQAMDLGIIVPLSAVAGVTLWRGRGLGYLLAGLVLTKAITMGPALISMGVFLTAARMPVALPMWVFAVLVTILGAYFAWRYLTALR